MLCKIFRRIPLFFYHFRFLRGFRAVFVRHFAKFGRTKTGYIIPDEAMQDDGSIIVHVKKQYNDKADVSEYFN